MSSPQRHLPPLPVRERAACMCAQDAACSVFAPGHALHLIQARLAAATPADWIDAIVTAVDPASGEVTVHGLADDRPRTVWNAAGAAATLSVGAPVALHGRYHVLSSGRRAFNVAPL